MLVHAPHPTELSANAFLWLPSIHHGGKCFSGHKSRTHSLNHFLHVISSSIVTQARLIWCPHFYIVITFYYFLADVLNEFYQVWPTKEHSCFGFFWFYSLIILYRPFIQLVINSLLASLYATVASQAAKNCAPVEVPQVTSEMILLIPFPLSIHYQQRNVRFVIQNQDQHPPPFPACPASGMFQSQELLDF